jgi:hypothetical protein
MTDDTCTWTGASGTTYLFYVYERPPAVPSRGGNFIYAHMLTDKVWVPAYMGHGDLAICCENDAERLACIDGKGATHIHMRLAPMDAEQSAVTADLLDRYRNAHAPEGCNAPWSAPPDANAASPQEALQDAIKS